MEQYIDKAAIVAEIERRIKINKECMLGLRNLDYYQGKVDALNDTISSLDTIEVKEVDFGTEVYKYIEEHFNVYDDGNQTLQTKDKKSLIGRVDVENIATHFFKLGLKAAQKGE